MAKRPCATCKGLGAALERFKPGTVRVRYCKRCGRWQTDLQAARGLFRRWRCVWLPPGEIGVLVYENDRVE